MSESPGAQLPQYSATPTVSRRTLFKGLAGAAGVAAIPGLAACGSGDGKGAGSDIVTFGSNSSDAVPKQAVQAAVDEFQKASGLQVKVNTVDHNTFQEQINNYLQGRPDDVFSWFAGFRMQFFAQRGLAGDISDVWAKVGGNYSEAAKQASTGVDGKQYFVPFVYYPWAVFYRKSVFQQRGYQVPKTLDEFEALSKRMRADGLTPLAFADKDGWPAMGTFDYLNVRINGFDFHQQLMGGEAAWDGGEVREVFDTWRRLLPYHQQGALGRTWQDAAQSVAKKKSGMYVLGMFVAQQFQGADLEDLDFFPFPEINSAHGQETVEAPIDGYMMSKQPKNEAGAKQLLEFLGSAEAQQRYVKADTGFVAVSSKADTSGYTPLQQKAVELVGSAKHITQFLDRDTRPDFASTVILPSLQAFIRNPNDVDGLVRKIEQQKKSIFTS